MATPKGKRPLFIKQKQCTQCGFVKTVDAFYTHDPDKPKWLAGRWTARCILCTRENVNERDRSTGLLRKYGITDQTYKKMLEEQKGVCFICHRPPKTRRLNVDHDHKTGAVRGLLCYLCNHVLGQWQDTAERFQRAVHYLERKKDARKEYGNGEGTMPQLPREGQG